MSRDKTDAGPLFSALSAHPLPGGAVSTQRMQAVWQQREYAPQSETRGRKAARQRARGASIIKVLNQARDS